MNRAAQWLIGSQEDVQRLRDTNRTMTRARMIAMAATVAVLPSFVGQFGWWLLPVAIAYISYARFVDYRYGVCESGEVWMFSLTLVTQAMFTLIAIFTGGPESPAVVLMILAVAISPTRYALAGVGFVLAFTVAGLAIASLSAGLDVLRDHPSLPLVTLATSIGCAACGIAARQSELVQRRAAAVDPLTGALNRTWLPDRFAELQAKATTRELRVALVICDLDHFKTINDLHGHAVGDRVLRETAAALRDEIDDDALLYRFGGEEFGILLLVDDPEKATVLGDRARAAVATAQPGGLPVTTSVGVAVSDGTPARFEDLFAAADAALYDAKRAGRDRTVTATAPHALRAVANG